jgi:hypothetical protein
LASMLSAQVSRHEQELEEIWWISTDVIDTLRQELSDVEQMRQLHALGGAQQNDGDNH